MLLRKQYYVNSSKKKKKILIAVGAVIIIIALIAVLYVFVFPNKKYNDAIKLADEGEYYESFLLFDELEDYKDCEKQKEKLKPSIIKNAEVGDIVFIGTDLKDDYGSESLFDIEWIVLDKQDDNILVICNDTLWDKEYNATDEYVTWESCSLRYWLNNDLFFEIFSEKEQMKILNSTVITTNIDSVSDGNNIISITTEDKLFLVSEEEAIKYGNTISSIDELEYQGEWWLRTPARYQNNALTYNSHSYDGYPMDWESGVRPAMWVKCK